MTRNPGRIACCWTSGIKRRQICKRAQNRVNGFEAQVAGAGAAHRFVRPSWLGLRRQMRT